MTFNGDLTKSLPHHLLTSGEVYLALGWSVIPTTGKVAAVAWKPYQRRQPGQKQFRRWFTDDGYRALAIITGPVSQLAVLDFDDPDLLTEFQTQHRHLTETYTVKTRRGYHLYYRVPSYLRLTSRKAPGVDLQYNGKYVIAPPSVVDEHVYAVVRGGLPKTLSQMDVSAIIRFLDRRRTESLVTIDQPVDVQTTAQHTSEKRSGPENYHAEPNLLPSDLSALYGSAAHRDGRNETLFRLACLGRDNGLCQGQVVEALAEKHARQPATGAHKKETYHQRYREATHSIQSAFKYKSRTRVHTYKEPAQLPNIVREALLDRKWTFAIRAIEALRLKGVRPGQQFTKKQAVALLKGIVGQGSIYNALNAMLTDEVALFESSLSPLPHTPSPPGYAVAKKQHQQTFSQCLEKRMTKPLKRGQQHRVAAIFIMPGNHELTAKLGVRHSNICDELTEDDLRSAKTTRTALHTGLLKRKPDQYTIRFFANRLGLSPRSIQRYNNEDDLIRCEPIFHEREVYWHNLDAIIPPESDYFPHEGVFLVDTRGKRYPARREIARKLLSQKQQIILKQQMASYWWYGDSKASMPVRFQADLLAIQDKLVQKISRSFQIPQPEYPSTIPVGQGDLRQDLQPAPRPNRPAPMPSSHTILHHRTPVVKSETEVNLKRPLDDLINEAFAQYVYKTINAMSEGKEGHISIFSARRMVVRYGEAAVRRALEIAAKQRNVHKPVGFVATLLRCAKRVEHIKVSSPTSEVMIQ